LIETINQVLTTIILLMAIVFIITATIILTKLGKRTKEKIEQVQPQIESAPSIPPPTKPQETQTTEEGIAKPEEYSWILQLGKKKKTTQTSNSST